MLCAIELKRDGLVDWNGNSLGSRVAVVTSVNRNGLSLHVSACLQEVGNASLAFLNSSSLFVLNGPDRCNAPCRAEGPGPRYRSGDRFRQTSGGETGAKGKPH